MHFDILIVVTPADCERVLPLYPRLVNKFDNGNICFIGAPKVGELAKSSAVADRTQWIDENDIIPFDEVHACLAKRLAPIIGGNPLPRGITGWYYQQFLKMSYAFMCKDEYYMSWDGDTIPCRKINMFDQKTGQPYLDMKHEYHLEYFETLGKILPGFSKVVERSFISEHMLFKCDIMKKLISDIESNDAIPGDKYWEKIINAIEPGKIYDSAFSEFETYGTYVAIKYPDVYRLREWHSFRLGGSFFDMNTICDRDFKWLAVDFDAISFEKGQSTANGTGGYFDNPKVQKKISAKKLLQEIQGEFVDAYKEVWDDDLAAAEANTRVGGYYKAKESAETPEFTGKEAAQDYVFDPGREVIFPPEWIGIFFDEQENKRHIELYGIAAKQMISAGKTKLEQIRSFLDEVGKRQDGTIVVMFAPTGLSEYLDRCSPDVGTAYKNLIKEIENMDFVVFDDNPDAAEIDMVLSVTDEYYGDSCRLADICRQIGIPVETQN